jgi:hypothetical protein
MCVLENFINKMPSIILFKHYIMPHIVLGTTEGLRQSTKWMMQRGILGQFRGARDALYGSLPASSLDLD